MNVYLFFYVVVEFDTWKIKSFLKNVHVSWLLFSESEEISLVFHTPTTAN